MKVVALAVLLAAGLAATYPNLAGAEPPALLGTWFSGLSGDQRGTDIALSGDGITLTGVDTTALRSLMIRLPSVPADSPTWSVSWPGAFPTTLEDFLGISVTATALYCSGTSYSQTTDGVGDKEPQGVLVAFPLTGATGGGVGGANWVAAPDFQSYSGNESLGRAAATQEGGADVIYVSGRAQAGGNNNTAVVAKYGASGEELWKATLGDTADGRNSDCTGLALLDGGIYVSGVQATIGVSSEARLWKLNPAGQVVWTRSFQSGSPETPALAVATGPGAIYQGGAESTGPYGGLDVFIRRYDTEGTALWTTVWGGSGTDYLGGMTVAGDRVYAVGQTSSFGAGGYDAFLLELDAASGTVLSSTYFGGAQNDAAQKVAVSGSSLYVVGESRSFATGANAVGENDAMVLHYSLGATTTASLDVDETLIPTGRSGWLRVRAKGLPAVSGAQLVLTLDTPAGAPDLEVDDTRVTAGGFLQSPSIAAKATGNQISIAIASAQPSPGDGLLLSVPVVVPPEAAPGTLYPISLSITKAVDSSGSPVVLGAQNGSLTVTELRSCGDASGDGTIDVGDVVVALRFVLGLQQPTPDQMTAVDLDGNGAIRIGEVVRILRALVDPEVPVTGVNCE
ncbi:MAG TPA: dockerin type I repeat-containing protein [Armatimonadota bacterium]